MTDRGRDGSSDHPTPAGTEDDRGGGWVLVVDDDPACARSTARVLGGWAACDVAASPKEALDRQAARPGLVGALVDLHLTGPGASFDGIRDVAIPLQRRQPGLDVRIFTGAPRGHQDVQRIVKEGYWYVLKGDGGLQLRALARLWGHLAANVALDADAALVARRIEALGESGALTPRQLEIVALKARGLSNAAVARRLGISTKAIEQHSAKAKLRTTKSLFAHAHEVVWGTRRVLRRLGDEEGSTDEGE